MDVGFYFWEAALVPSLIKGVLLPHATVVPDLQSSPHQHRHRLERFQQTGGKISFALAPRGQIANRLAPIALH